ncbi:hypothetical protein HH212_15125 [Massilia forsythiae]|uniref:Uncharacterized protein n=1 Tax=Massilia forsythiae TaxID=2728020 RepID=A0A7Z2VY40_9BURK|nr:hypothetical protein [Massilia forsythiae]QJE01200.1 hypothetical protein HH212_15125 [Massilia forsythiae]
MKIGVAVTELQGVRVAIAFPPPAYVTPGAGDALLARLQPYFPALPVMLASVQKHGARVHAAFQAPALAEGADLGALPRSELDLDVAPPLPDAPPPF